MMPEENSSPSDSPGDEALDPADELDVEAALAEAAGLSTELENEIGATDASTDIGHDAVAPAQAADLEDVGAKLGDVEQLLADVRGEDERADEKGTKEVEAAHRDGVGEGAEGCSASAVQPGAAEQSSVGGLASAESGRTESPADDTDAWNTVALPTSEARTPGHPGGGVVSRLRAVWGALVLRLHRLREIIIETTLGALDAVDGVFTWINLDARRIIGWVALAILMAACSITVYSVSN